MSEQDAVKDTVKGTSVNIQEIMELIPHRFPFLLIDAIEEMDGEERAVGIKNVTANEPWVPGHFPDWPVMPGVLIVEAMAQTAAALVVHNRKDEVERKVIYFMSVDKCRFRNAVMPGDVLKIEILKIKSKGPVWKYKGIARVGDKICTEAEFMAMNYDPDEAGSK